MSLAPLSAGRLAPLCAGRLASLCAGRLAAWCAPLALFALLGCADLPPQPVPGEAPLPGPGGSGQEGAPPAGPGAGAPAGPPPAPLPGDENQTEMPWSRAQGQTVTLSGTATYQGSRTGRVRIDFLGATEANVGLQQMLMLPEPGAWTVQAPTGAGQVHVVAFLQEGQSGPPLPDQPAGRLAQAIEIGDQDLSGLDLVLTDDPELGDLTPRSPGEGGPAPGAPPPTEGTPAPPEQAPPTP